MSEDSEPGSRRRGGKGCKNRQQCILPEPAAELRQKLLRGNNYAQYTREIEFRNGPEDWVEHYSNAETVMVLNKMIALALARMVNLKSFTWDMPTRITSDVWSALSSGAHSRLQSIWVRSHESFDVYWDDLSNTDTPRNHDFDYPTLSTLPSVKDLAVFGIDQAPYLEELAVLIERSRDRLRALRICLDWRIEHWTWQKPPVYSSHASSTWPKLGGILEVLTGSFQGNILQKLNKTSESSTGVDAFLRLEVLELEQFTLSIRY